ncbi:MAG: hypothetical protein R3338_15295, partial [Thermoanaerobaculia bacterium]|nr:hypothetical protein [Thermoanaerobaculia bacterium]
SESPERSQPLWVCNADGSGREQMTSLMPPTDPAVTDWISYPTDDAHSWPVVSPDGEWVVFTESRSFRPRVKESKLVRVRTDGTGRRTLTPPDQIANRPVFTHDGNWVIYTSYDESGVPTAMKVSIHGGVPVRMPFDRECATNDIDRTGSMMICCDRESNEYLVSLEGGLLWEGDLPARHPIRFTPDNLMSYVDPRDGNVWAEAVDGSPRRQLTSFDSLRVLDHAWHPTENRLVVSRGGWFYEAVIVSNLPEF